MEGEEFIRALTEGKDYSYQGPYWAPYRCLYSRNLRQLFMAGRDISVPTKDWPGARDADVRHDGAKSSAKPLDLCPADNVAARCL